MKRILSLILCLAMVLSMVPAQAFAGETDSGWTVTFDANGGEGVMDPLTIPAEGAVLTTNAFVRTCHAFLGWNTKADGTGTEYDDEETVTLTEDVTLYAQWQEAHTKSEKTEYSQRPGCTTTGEMVTIAFCGVCGKELGRTSATVPSLGHSWQEATCAAPKTCAVCKITEGESLPHTEVVDKAVAPTCTTTGLTEGKHCSVCNTVLKKQEVVEAKGHTPGAAATCTTNQICTVCKTELNPAKGHTEVVDKAVAPTCTTTGLTEGKHCSVCSTVLKKQEVVEAKGHTPGAAATCTTNQICTVCKTELNPAKGHTEVVDKAVAPTCTTTGLTEGKHCSVCNTVLKKQEVVEAKGHTPGAAATCTTNQICTVCKTELNPAKGHTEVVDKAVAPTCTATGLTEGKHCSVCNTVLKKQEVVEAKGHKDENLDHICDNGCGVAQGQHKDASTDNDHVCDYCGKEVENGEICTDVTTDKDHNCDVCGKKNVTQHIYTATGYVWAADGSGCTAHGKCNCGAVITAEATVTAKVTKAATCTAVGTTTYTAAFAGVTWAETQTKSLQDLPELGHSYPAAPSSYKDITETQHTEVYVCGNDSSHTKVLTVDHTYASGTHVCPCSKVERFTVTFTVNGQKYGQTESVAFGKTIPVPNYTVPLGYSFSGWTVPATMPAENITLEASLTANIYDAVFDGNMGSWADGSAKKTVPTAFDAKIAAPADPARNGYTFAGWTPAVGIMNETGKKFTAQWKVITYGITYDLAGGQLPAGVTNPAEYTIETNTFTLTNPSRVGYEFAGWTGTGLTAPAMTVKIEKGSIENRTYTANWKPIVYQIGYDLAGGQLPTGVTNPAEYTIETNTFTLTNPSRVGYEFAGWTGTGLTAPVMTVKIEKGSIENRTYTANWKPIVYQIGYDLAGGQLPEGVTNPAEYTIETNTFTLTNPSRVGYEFAGWTGTGLTAPAMTVKIEKGSIDNRTYTANWKPIVYQIGYDLAGGQLPAGVTNPAEYTIETNTFTLTNPSRVGYEFAGWTGTGLTAPAMTVKIEKGSIENRTYTANWKPIVYQIGYDLAGGQLPEGVTNPAEYTIETNTFTLNNPERDGYTFLGWTGTDLTETTEKVTVVVTEENLGGMAFTAQWKCDHDTKIYPDNGDGTHKVICTYGCCEILEEKVRHSYESGFCICGKAEPEDFAYLEQLYWDLYEGKLTVTGQGDIRDGASWEKHAGRVTEIRIGNGITAIGAGAFKNFDKLESLSFPGAAPVVGGAFEGCYAVKYITVTGDGCPMADYTKDSCVELPWFRTKQTGLKVYVAEGVTSIGQHTFFGAEKVVDVKLPGTLLTIGAGAFQNSGLRSLYLPKGITAIGSYALSGLKNVQTLVIPDSVTTLGDFALSSSFFQAVELSQGLTAISAGLFSGCEKLKALNIPTEVAVIGEGAFRDCKGLRTVSIPEGVQEIPAYAFENCGLYSISLPENLTSIGDSAFSGNSDLVKLTIPANVSYVGKRAFNACSWLDTLIMKSIAFTVDESAFASCGRLKTICYVGTKEQWKENVVISRTGNNLLLVTDNIQFGIAASNPVQEVHIRYKSGLDDLGLEPDTVLDGKILLIPMKEDASATFTLDCVVSPEDATHAGITWSDPRPIAVKVEGENNEVQITGKKPGDVVLDAQNYVDSDKQNVSFAAAFVRLQFRQMVITNGAGAFVQKGDTLQMTAKIEGDGDYDRGICWSVEEGADKATITADGKLTGRVTGEVKVVARTTDGSNMSVETSVTITDETLKIRGPEQVVSGKNITLTAEWTDAGFAGRKVLWCLAGEKDAQYATISSSTGKLTAKKVTGACTVTVKAYTADGLFSAVKPITVLPAVSAVTIRRDGQNMTGKTIAINLKNPEEKILTLTADTSPGEAIQAVTWSTSDTKGKFAAYTANEDGSYTLEAKDTTGEVTLTATAADGSGKKATVKVQFAKLSDQIVIYYNGEDIGLKEDNQPKVSIRGGEKITLTTNLQTEADLSDRNVIWEVDDASTPYASINAKGLLTTKAHPDVAYITVRATMKAKPEIWREARIEMKPGAQTARISCNGDFYAKNETIYAAVGSTVILQGSVLPANAYQGGTWKEVAGLRDKGDGIATVTMATPGSVTAAFTAGDGSKKTTSVKVQFVYQGTEMSITAKGGATQLPSGGNLELTAAVKGAEVKNFRWTVSDPSVATVTAKGAKGKVQAAKTVYENTEVTVTATALDGSNLEASYVLLIKPAKDETLHIRLNGQVITDTTQYMKEGDVRTLTAEVYNAVKGQWETVDAKLSLKGNGVKQEGNVFTATTRGKTTNKATVTASFGKLSAKVTLQVVNPVEKVTITGDPCCLTAGKSLKLTAKVQGAGGAEATMKKPVWSVDNTAVATISASGVLKAAKTVTEATAVTVTASPADGLGEAATQVITIYPAASAIVIKAQEKDGAELVLNMCTREYKVGTTLNLSAKVYPEGTLQHVKWSINNAKFAHFDDDGNLVLDAKGTLTIKAALCDGSGSVSVKIKILP